MSADSAAPSIETKSRQELVRLILEANIGPAPDDAASGTLNWKSLPAGACQQSGWRTCSRNRPARWLPAGYSDYPSLLVAAVENALKQPDVPADVSQWKWGKIYPVEIETPRPQPLALIGKFTGPGPHPLQRKRLSR